MLGKIESFVYNAVKRNTFIKNLLRDSYQLFFALAARKGYESKYKMVIRDNCFFGFHDKSPWSPDGRYLLGHSYLGKGNENCETIHSVEIVLFDGNEWTKKRNISSTGAFNWQQGSQLQWLSDNEVIFNDFEDGKCVSRIVDLNGEQISVLPYPVAALAPASRYFASICFYSFGNAMPGYGYNFSGGRNSSVSPGNIIIYAIDSCRELYKLSREEISRESPLARANSNYFVSHAMFSPDGSRLAFMVRVAPPGRRVESELLLFDLRSGSLAMTPFRDMVSHYTFLGNDKILLFASYESSEGFFIYHLSSGAVEDISMYLGARDGHPSTAADGVVVYDTYPDRKRRQTLFIWSGKEQPAEPVASLYSPLNFRDEYRVDLHPRIKEDGSAICVDTSVNGIRSMATFKIR